jgi:hypothetical protein
MMDFNYLEASHLLEDAKVNAGRIRIEGMHCDALILEEVSPEQPKRAIDILVKAGRIIH